MRTDRAASSIKGTSESSKRVMALLHTRMLPERALISKRIMTLLHTRMLPERALIYTQQSLFTLKTKHQNTQPTGCHKNVLKSQNGPPLSQVYLPTGYGPSEAEVYALFYCIRPTLRPPGQNVNMTNNPGKRTTTSTAGAPFTGGHARFDMTAEVKLSASQSVLIASLELCRKIIPSEWKDRLSARTACYVSLCRAS